MPEDLALLALIERWKKPKRQRTESTLVKRLITTALKRGITLWRNQVGTYRLADGRYITSGLCVGSADLIGYTRTVITPEMVGRTVAVFTAIEAKSATGRASSRQLAFLERVREAGGIAVVARSERDLE